MHKLGTYVHISVWYEVSMIKALTGMAIHRCWQCRWCRWWQPQRRTEHDCIGSLPNEPKSTCNQPLDNHKLPMTHKQQDRRVGKLEPTR